MNSRVLILRQKTVTSLLRPTPSTTIRLRRELVLSPCASILSHRGLSVLVQQQQQHQKHQQQIRRLCFSQQQQQQQQQSYSHYSNNSAVVRNHANNSRSRSSWRWMAAAAGALGLATTTITTSSVLASSCEEQQHQQPQQKSREGEEQEEEANHDMKKWEIGPDDPYYDIPAEDEPTDCSMCLTFRQGPCRLDWKRFELCVKDKDKGKEKEKEKEKNDATTKEEEEEEEDPTACMKYAMPFYNCSTKHVNTYLIIGTDQTQKTVIEPLMESYDSPEAQSRRLCFLPNNNNNILLDWTNWEKFVTALYDLGGHVPTKYDLEKTKFQSAADALRASWANNNNNNSGKMNQYLMMNDEGEPFLITVTIQVPKTPPPGPSASSRSSSSSDKTNNNNNLLFMTFALDQSGNLMGDARNNDHDTDDNINNNDEKVTTTAAEDDQSNRNEKVVRKNTTTTTITQELQVQIVPGVTEAFTVYGLYVPKDKDFLTDGIMYESQPYKLETITKGAIKKAKKLAKKKKNNKEKKEEGSPH